MKRTSQLLAALALAASPACTSPDSVDDRSKTSGALAAPTEQELADGDVFSLDVTAEGPANGAVQRGVARRGGVSAADLGVKKSAPATDLAPPKIHPNLRGKTGSLDVIVVLHEDFQHVKLPRLAPSETREDASWLAKASVIDAHIQKATAARNASQDRLIKKLAAKGASVNQRFWIINAFGATIDASQLAELEADPQVKQVSPTIGGHLLADIVAGRNAMSSDPYFNVGLASGWIALLDSGIRASHTLLSGRTSWVRDCVNGLTNNCSTAGPGLTLDPSDVRNHGTGVAAIMSGQDTLGFNLRGTTAIPIDSFRVVVPAGGIDYGAVARGYSAAVAGGDNVVNASFDCGSTVCSDSANGAFDLGLVVVAAAGNSGTSPVGDPASGKKVLAVGGIDATTWAKLSYSSTGPSAYGGATKPDLMAVSGNNVTGDFLSSGSNVSDNATAGFWGTSFASPFVTGGAGLMRRWLTFTGQFVADAGQTYAMLIAAGTNFSTVPIPSADNSQGAGRLALPLNATIYGGTVTVTSSGAATVPISVSAGVTSIDVAIWWPEGQSAHNDIDMQLLKPDGTVAASSTGAGSVWEKAHFATTTAGTWTIRAYPYSVSGSQTVYVAGIRR